jgi:7-cyano-7-deazaguanine reductase
MKELPLGKSTNYPISYDSNLLVAMNRLDSRRKLDFEDSVYTMYGIDAWTSYELSWLDLESIPKNGILYLTYLVSSKNFIESKSLKLYLNSLNNTKFSSKDDLFKTLQKDLDQCVQDSVSIEIVDSPKLIKQSTQTIDDSSVENISPEVNSLVLKTESTVSEENLSSELFRSLCPVTSQPDWATISIYYRGPKIIKETLLSYLLSYRNHHGFHEECVERIFFDILKRCNSELLTVRANFLRRGGIEINPIRSTLKDFDEEQFRGARQ